MGFTPQEIDEMSLWEFEAALNGYIEANTSEDDTGLTQAERDEIANDILNYS